MKKLSALFAIIAMLFSNVAAAGPAVSEDDAYAIGVEAYTYSYPLVLMEMTRRVTTNVATPGANRAPTNRFANMPSYPDAGFHDVVRPNADTLYSSLWYDVGREPLILTLPDTAGRYHVIPIMDMWTDVFATLGSRTTGTGGGIFALVGPHWQGALPKGVRRIVSPTETGWIIGRFQANGAADYGNVHKLQAGLRAVPLSGWGRSYVPPRNAVDPAIDMKTAPVDQVARLDAAAFFALFADLMERNPPHAADYPILLRMERIGLVPGKSFDLAKADPVVRDALIRAAADGYKRIVDRRRTFGIPRNGWISPAGMIGSYGNDYLMRAFIGYAGLGALPPDEAIYPFGLLDGDGKLFTGAARYVLHFDKAQLPPAAAFWSLTMYGPDQFFVANPINRFAIGDRDKLMFNADGSLDLYIQHDSPGADREANWLPAPAGPFSMNLRLYLPRPQAVDGRWVPPAIKRIS